MWGFTIINLLNIWLKQYLTFTMLVKDPDDVRDFLKMSTKKYLQNVLIPCDLIEESDFRKLINITDTDLALLGKTIKHDVLHGFNYYPKTGILIAEHSP